MAVVERQVSADEDDLYSYGGAHSPAKEYVYMSYATASTLLAGFRFLNVVVPQGAEIAVATLSVYQNANADLECDIYGEDVDNSGVLEGGDLIDGRDKTAATVNWTATLEADDFTVSPDIKSIIQEIVNREGWESGNALTLLTVDSQAVKNGRAWDYSGDTAKAAKLSIEWGLPPRGTQAWIGKWA